jgi:pyruvate,water dikinase
MVLALTTAEDGAMTPAVDSRPGLVWLRDSAAADAELVGAKAAALARAAAAGLPVLDGFVLTTSTAGRPQVADAWRVLSHWGTEPMVVRSSSVAEDGAAQSMAGLFTSVLDVRGWSAFRRAVDEVLASGGTAGPVDAPMAVLVQPFLDAEWGGVLFSADPVSGRRDRMVVTAVRGGADAVVGGGTAGWTATLRRRGRVDEVRSTEAERPPASLLRQLAALARQVEDVFGGPQDVEWAADWHGRVRLLQSRPITTLHGPPTGPVFGPGPVAETFPDALSPLEQDLWLDPLRDGLRTALRLTGAAPSSRIRHSPVVVAVDGVAALDLDLLGVNRPRRSLLRRLDPRPPARRLAAAWRVGRLAAALPDLARDIAGRVDDDLAAVPRLDYLDNRSLLAVLHNGRRTLAPLYGYESLAGMLATERTDSPTAASMALSALAQARADGVEVEDLVADLPVVLALVPPRIGDPAPLPAFGAGLRSEPPPAVDELAVAREALRLRTRWVQELTARAAWELGRRLEAVGILDAQEQVRLLRLDELEAAFDIRSVPAEVDGRAAAAARALPNRFRLAADGTPVPVARRGTSDGEGGGVGAGGGVGRGPVHVGDDPPAGAVLVVRHLDPRLAPVLPRLAGLVAETGSPLSHLAILAREHGVPTVVGRVGATEQLATGTVVTVDGTTGEVAEIVGDLGAELAAELEPVLSAARGGR